MKALRATFLALALALVASTAWAQTTWNPADKNANITLSGGNLTASASAGGDNLVRSTTSKTTGKWYWEVHQDHQGGEDSPGGIGTASESLSNFAGQTANSLGWYHTGQVYISGLFNNFIGWTSNDVLGLALDLTTSPPTLTLYNRTAGTGPSGFNLTGNGGGHNLNSTPWFALADVPSGSTMTINFGATAFTGTIPSGYSAWDAPAPPASSGGAALMGGTVP